MDHITRHSDDLALIRHADRVAWGLNEPDPVNVQTFERFVARKVADRPWRLPPWWSRPPAVVVFVVTIAYGSFLMGGWVLGSLGCAP